MEPLGLWEKILIGVVAVLVLLWFRPGVKAALANSRKATADDWRALLLPIGAVVLFVTLLIYLVRR